MGGDGVVAIGQKGKVFGDAVHVLVIATTQEKHVFGLLQFPSAPFHVVRDVDKDCIFVTVLITKVFHGVVEIIFVQVVQF